MPCLFCWLEPYENWFYRTLNNLEAHVYSTLHWYKHHLPQMRVICVVLILLTILCIWAFWGRVIQRKWRRYRRRKLLRKKAEEKESRG